MKIALVLPPVTTRERYNKALTYVTGSLPPLGLLSLGTVLKENGHDVIIIDGTIQAYEEMIAQIDEFKPAVVGISAMTMMWPKAKILSRNLKELLPEIKIIVGGVHASLIRERALAETPYIDAVAYGEGDFSMLEYVENMPRLNSIPPLGGIAFRREDGSLAVGPNRQPIADLDQLPIPDRSLVPVTRYTGAFHQNKLLPVTNVVTTRGCPFHCIFCMPDLLGRKVRYRSVTKVIKEIEYLIVQHGIRDIAFFDDTFTLNRNRILSLCEKIRERRINFVWSANARADCVDPEMLEQMARAGCWKLFYGVESLVQKNLDILEKGETVEDFFQAIRWSKEAGIEVEASFIFGIPGETYTEGLETIRLALKLDPDYAKFFPLSPYGGKLLSEVNRYGKLLTDDEQLFSSNNITFIPFTMSKKELQKLYYKSYRRFYLRPKVVFRRLKKMGQMSEVKKSFYGLISLFYFLVDEFMTIIGTIDFF
ncbi:MAG: radical SAM protein [Candidatus Aminicenantales bacterium]